VEFNIFTGSWIALFFIFGGIFETPLFADAQHSAWESANTAGMEAYRQGRYSEAKQWFLQALSEAERSGEPSPSQAMTLNNLAAVHEALGESEDAELRYQQSLFVIEAIQGPNHPDLVPGLNNLALLYIQDGKFQQAEPLLRRSLTILESHLGENHAHG
jgi:Flp pilus assembly protein TadD